MILVNEIQRLYDEYGSISRVSRELKISWNTVRKYLHRIQEVRNGFQEKLVFDPQKPIRPKRIVTPQLIEFVHRKLPTKQEIETEDKTAPKLSLAALKGLNAKDLALLESLLEKLSDKAGE